MDHLDVEWFAVWNRDLPAESKRDPSSSGRAVTSEHGSSSLEVAGNDPKHDNEDDDEESGILYKYAANQNEAGESLSRRIGLAQGLIDFASSFNLPKQAEDDLCDDNDIRVVNSARQRMIFLRPEPIESYWIVCALPTSHAGIVHSRESSAASTITPSKVSKSSNGAQGRPLTSEVYVNLVKDAYSEFALLHGDFSYLNETKGKIELQKALQTFFDPWCRRPVTATGLGVLRNPAMLSLPINDALLPFNPSSLLITNTEGILHLPDTSTIPHKSALAIARYLYQRFDQAENTPDRDLHENKASKKKIASLGIPHAATSTWKRSLSLGGIGGYIGMPGSNSTIKPAADNTDIKLSTQQSSHAIGEKSWINPMNLFGSSTKAKAIPLTAETDTKVTVSMQTNALDNPKADVAESVERSAAGEESVDSVTRAAESALTDAQMRRSASLGVSEALQAAIGADLHLVEPQSEDRKATQDVILQTNADTFQTIDIYVQETKEWKILYIVQLEGFTLAYVGESSNVTSATRIASACKKVLRGLPHTTSVQYYRTDSKSATDYVNVDDTALSTSASADARQEAASNAVADLARFSKSHLSELFVRTSLSTWLVARPARRDEGSAHLSDITILPKSIGKEGSLADADAPLQRSLDRVKQLRPLQILLDALHVTWSDTSNLVKTSLPLAKHFRQLALSAAAFQRDTPPATAVATPVQSKTGRMANSTTSTSSSASSMFSDWLGGKRCSASLIKGNNGQMLGYQVKDDVEQPLFFVPNVYYSKSDMAAIEKVDHSKRRLSLFARKGWFGDYYLEAKASG